MEVVDFQDLVQSLGIAGPFVWYLIHQAGKDREERERRRLADIRLALALERFVQRLTGQPLVIPTEEKDG